MHTHHIHHTHHTHTTHTGSVFVCVCVWGSLGQFPYKALGKHVHGYVRACVVPHTLSVPWQSGLDLPDPLAGPVHDPAVLGMVLGILGVVLMVLVSVLVDPYRSPRDSIGIGSLWSSKGLY